MAVQLNNGVTDEYLYVDNTATPISSAATDVWSMACWIYRDTDTGGVENIAQLATDAVGSASSGQGFRISAGDTLQTVTSGGTSQIRVTQLTGEWAYVAATFGNGTGTSYWGTTPGSLTAGAARANVAGVLDTLAVGRSPAATALPFSGRIAHLRLWTGALSEAEFEAESLSLTAVKTSGLWAAYEFPEGTGYKNDSSGNGRHLNSAGVTSVGNWIAGPTLGGSSQSNAPRSRLLQMLRNA
jgi:hypothetical protein